MRKLYAAALLAGLTVPGIWAQFRSDTRLVVLHASVVDKKGKLVTNLNRDAFKVFENQQAQEIKVFRREDVPVSLGIIIDDSGSMMTKRARVEAAALAMVKESNPQDEVFIVNFNDDAYLDVPFTNDIHKMEQGLARIDSRGGTAMRDAINMSLDYERGEAKKDKKVLMVITDGNDNASNLSLERLVQRANQMDTLGLRDRALHRRRETRSDEGAPRVERTHERDRRVSLLSQGRERSAIAGGGDCARHSQPVHHRLHAKYSGSWTAAIGRSK